MVGQGEVDENVRCPTCRGPGIFIGPMGDKGYYRCRNCGMDFYKPRASVGTISSGMVVKTVQKMKDEGRFPNPRGRPRVGTRWAVLEQQDGKVSVVSIPPGSSTTQTGIIGATLRGVYHDKEAADNEASRVRRRIYPSAALRAQHRHLEPMAAPGQERVPVYFTKAMWERIIGELDTWAYNMEHGATDQDEIAAAKRVARIVKEIQRQVK